jgi:S-DNA-T family DNA segregation ATPase FtsK/SpoIIIE
VSPGTGRPENLVREAGILFLDQGRVAVSLLQRRFDLDFDEACEVLDQLQEMGLIGPFMGGQRRDILLTLEEWQGRVTSS